MERRSANQRRSEQFQAGRKRQAAGDGLHLVLQQRLGLAPRVGMGGHDEVLHDLLLRRLHQRVVDLDGLHLALSGELDADEAAARGALHLELVELGLHRFHLGLELSGLLHQAQEISHCSVLLRRASDRLSSRHQSSSSGRTWAPNAEPSSSGACSASSGSPVGSAGGNAASPLRTSTISAPGKRASTACTSGSARTPLLSSACRASFCDLTVGPPGSADTTTIQRRLVHCENLRARSLTSVFAALGSRPISSRPSSQRTSRTSRSSASLTPRSRFCTASAISSSKPPTTSAAGPGSGSGRRATSLDGASAARGAPREVSTRGAPERDAEAIGAGAPAPDWLGARAAVPLPPSERTTSSGVGRSAA